MKRWEEHATVHAPPSEVFAYISDFERHGEWSHHGLTASKVGNGPIGVGTKYQTVAKQFGTQKEESTITQYEPGRKFCWDSVGGLGKAHHQFALIGDEAGHGTALSKSVELIEPSFLAKVMGWRLNKDIPKSLQSDVEKIKAALEKK